MKTVTETIYEVGDRVIIDKKEGCVHGFDHGEAVRISAYDGKNSEGRQVYVAVGKWPQTLYGEDILGLAKAPLKFKVGDKVTVSNDTRVTGKTCVITITDEPHHQLGMKLVYRVKSSNLEFWATEEQLALASKYKVDDEVVVKEALYHFFDEDDVVTVKRVNTGGYYDLVRARDDKIQSVREEHIKGKVRELYGVPVFVPDMSYNISDVLTITPVDDDEDEDEDDDFPLPRIAPTEMVFENTTAKITTYANGDMRFRSKRQGQEVWIGISKDLLNTAIADRRSRGWDRR